MGQGDILKVLKKNKGKWLTGKQISEMIGVSQATPSLRKLRENNDVSIKKEPVCRNLYKYLYRFKERKK